MEEIGGGRYASSATIILRTRPTSLMDPTKCSGQGKPLGRVCSWRIVYLITTMARTMARTKTRTKKLWQHGWRINWNKQTQIMTGGTTQMITTSRAGLRCSAPRCPMLRGYASPSYTFDLLHLLFLTIPRLTGCHTITVHAQHVNPCGNLHLAGSA